MEAYMDDMLVKNRKAKSHIANLTDIFATLTEYGMKLNLNKCAFKVSSNKFLGYIVIQCKIKANLDKIKALINMESFRKLRDIQHLISRLVALN